MSESKHTQGPWYNDHAIEITAGSKSICGMRYPFSENLENSANARLIAAAPDMFECLEEGRRAIGQHNAPTDCYATGPVTGDTFRDLVQCPACSFISMYEAVKARISGAGLAEQEAGE